MPRLRNPLTLVLWASALVALGAFLWVQVISPRMTRGLADMLGRGDYRLQATDGSAFTQATLRGRPSAVFFGFTHCPDVCPTTLGEVAAWQEALAAEDKDLRVFFVTVDPERDTAELLHGYVSWIPGVLGVTGPRDQIDSAIRAFRIYARKVPLEGGGYTMDHSAMVLLFDKRGRFAQPVGYREDFDRAMAKVRALY